VLDRLRRDHRLTQRLQLRVQASQQIGGQLACLKLQHVFSQLALQPPQPLVAFGAAPPTLAGVTGIDVQPRTAFRRMQPQGVAVQAGRQAQAATRFFLDSSHGRFRHFGPGRVQVAIDLLPGVAESALE
jgi:hypothetical protein